MKAFLKIVKGSETEKNLLKAFAGESQARNRYTYFASVAKNICFDNEYGNCAPETLLRSTQDASLPYPKIPLLVQINQFVHCNSERQSR